jgi:dihydrofolate reductase
MLKPFSMIVCMCKESQGIGSNGGIPWKCKADMDYFRQVTSNTSNTSNTDSLKKNAVIMGYNTWKSLPNKYKPLPNRYNVILSKNIEKGQAIKCEHDTDNVVTYSSFLEAHIELSNKEEIEQIFIIGGETLYKECIQSKYCITLYVNTINQEYENIDTFFPLIDSNIYELTHQEDLIENNEVIGTIARHIRITK